MLACILIAGILHLQEEGRGPYVGINAFESFVLSDDGTQLLGTTRNDLLFTYTLPDRFRNLEPVLVIHRCKREAQAVPQPSMTPREATEPLRP